MPRILGLVESPAQLLNAIEWAYAEQVDAHLIVLGPPDPVTRFQLHRLSELVGADGFRVGWAEIRASARRAQVLARLTGLVRAADTIVLGDPYSGMIHTLLNAARDPQLVVVDDGTATLRYADQWADGTELKRWHLAARSGTARVIGARAQRMLGRRSPAVRLFTAMPVRPDIPAGANTYAWVRQRFPVPSITAGTDLMGSSLVETGVITEAAYLAGVGRLAGERTVTRYLPHRRESELKLARIEGLGIRILRPDLPMEVYARRGPIGREILSFPSTVLHTLPLVLSGTGVTVRALSVENDWFAADVRGEEVDFVHSIQPAAQVSQPDSKGPAPAERRTHP